MITSELNIARIPITETSITIGEMVVADYRKAEVFRKFGIDYCCGGKKPLEEVCLKKNIDPEQVWQALYALDQAPETPEHDVENQPLDELAAHIVATHHQYVASALPILYELTAKVARVHGERHLELIGIAQHFNAIADELQMHMHKEEQMLFPYIGKMAVAKRQGSRIAPAIFGSVANPIRMMESEHESAGSGMEEIRRLSAGFTPPTDACTSYRVLFAKLEEFEQDLHRHVHLENNILFPRAVQMEQEMLSK
jgi:regulator of cell morphogenesis and NO signaling